LASCDETLSPRGAPYRIHESEGVLFLGEEAADSRLDRLRREIYDTVDYLFSLLAATTARKENVHLTPRRPDVVYVGDESPVTPSFDRTITLR
jgi:hypothetical protein